MFNQVNQEPCQQKSMQILTSRRELAPSYINILVRAKGSHSWTRKPWRNGSQNRYKLKERSGELVKPCFIVTDNNAVVVTDNTVVVVTDNSVVVVVVTDTVVVVTDNTVVVTNKCCCCCHY